MAEGNAAGLKAVIIKLCDGHEMDAAGLTPLHRAAQRGLYPDMVSELLHLGVSPHVLTPDGMTPADLARRAGHEEVLEVLSKHQCGESPSSPEELQNELFTLIIQGDHVQKVSRLLCMGVPIEPIASDANSPLRLAVILDRRRTVNLLLASGAMLPACLLQDAWQSPDVTSGVLATLKANYLWRLRAERGRLDSSRQSEERRRLFTKGIDDILKTIEGDTPWQAAWPKDKPKALSALMVEAVHAKCPVTAAFLHRAGAWSFLSGDRGASALATALEEGHKGMAELLVKHLGTSIYSDVHLLNRIKPEERRRLEQVMSGEAMSGEVMSGEVMSGEVMSGEVMSGEVMSGEVMSGKVMSGQVMSGEVMSGEVMSGEAMSGEVMSGEVMSGEVMSGEVMSGEVMSGEVMSGKVMSGQVMSGKVMSGEVMSGKVMSGKVMSGEVISGEAMSGDPDAMIVS
ncbi:ankyrin-1-like [Eriocheir sinensis]|uniref:ankyrin-1-like n=1 Tax=Eriocheir sinensis TaxID=95602 RepID=UPI0021C61627|nr:ankyrin-1-like [Eriocheir sinensis]